MSDKIEEIFALCTASTNSSLLYFTEVSQYLWPILNNSLTLCDLSGIFSIANPRGNDALDLNLFREFLNSISKIKYPTEANHLGLLIDEITQAKQLKYQVDNLTFHEIMDKSVMRILLKYDLPLRRAFGAFAGRGVKVGGGLTWDEVKRMEIGMDIEGFTSFAGSCSLIPSHLTLQQCTTIARDVLNRFPLLKSASTLSSTLLYPQFQLLLCFAAAVVDGQRANNSLQSSSRTDKNHVGFKRTPNSTAVEKRAMSVCLTNLLSEIGIDLVGSLAPNPSSTYRPTITASINDQDKFTSHSPVLLPSSSHPEDLYSRAGKNVREAMIIRMENIFDEVEARLAAHHPEDDENEYNPFDLENLSSELEENSSYSDRRNRHLSKPVVIGDSIPPPLHCPTVVQHSLEAALAHHNLGSYEESLKYLETAKIQLYEEEKEKLYQKKKAEKKKLLSLTANQNPNDTSGTVPTTPSVSAENNKTATLPPLESPTNTHKSMDILVSESEVTLPVDIHFYLIACKGNVYQSCGDDELSLLQYMAAWEMAQRGHYSDWEILFINSIGLLAYYNLHYELAMKCFSRVSHFREREYGGRSADTATSWNNQGACLYCLGRRGAARVLFERARMIFMENLGSRHPRTVVSAKNCEKAKRSQTIVHDQNIKASIAMRPDSSRLLIGKEITIQGLPPIPTNTKSTSSKKASSTGAGNKKK